MYITYYNLVLWYEKLIFKITFLINTMAKKIIIVYEVQTYGYQLSYLTQYLPPNSKLFTKKMNKRIP